MEGEDYSVRKMGKVLDSKRSISLDIHFQPKSIMTGQKNPRERDTLKFETLGVII